MSKTYKQQPKQPKPKRDRHATLQAHATRDWKSALEWRLGKDD
jgi:hypothetical protein